MNALLADALQDCLERIEAGEPLDAALARHGAHAMDLRPLIVAALLVREHRPLPTPGFRARVQVALANIDLDAAPDAADPPRLPAPRRAAWRPLVARLCGALAAVAMLAGGVVVASANSRPGDLLYPVRRGVEHVREVAVSALMPVVTGVQAPRQAEVRPAAQPTRAALLAPGWADSRGPVARRDAGGGDLDAAAEESVEGVDAPARPRGRPADERGGAEYAPADAADAAPEQPVTAPTALPTLTFESEAKVAAPEPTATPDAAGRRQPESAPTRALVAVATSVTLDPGPAVAPTQVVVIPLPELPRSGSPDRGGIAGVVTREDGSPREAARIYLYPPKPDDDRGRWHPWRETRSDEDGRYRFDNLRPGRYVVLAAYSSRRGNVWRWYPNATDSDDAEEITVSTGYIRDAIDFRFDRMPWVIELLPIPFPWPRGS